MLLRLVELEGFLGNLFSEKARDWWLERWEEWARFNGQLLMFIIIFNYSNDYHRIRRIKQKIRYFVSGFSSSRSRSLASSCIRSPCSPAYDTPSRSLSIRCDEVGSGRSQLWPCSSRSRNPSTISCPFAAILHSIMKIASSSIRNSCSITLAITYSEAITQS